MLFDSRSGHLTIWCVTVALLVGSASMAAEDPIERARGLLVQGQAGLALEVLDGILATDPGNSVAQALRLEAEALAKKVDDSHRVAQMLAEAQTYVAVGQPYKAQKRLKALLELEPTNAEAMTLLEQLELESEMDLLATEASGDVIKEGDFVDLGEVDVAPQVVERVAATYPPTARRMRIEGKARFLATVGVDGRVEDLRILQKIEGWDAMNRSAEKAVKRYRFTPALKDGIKVKTIVNLAVDFRL